MGERRRYGSYVEFCFVEFDGGGCGEAFKPDLLPELLGELGEEGERRHGDYDYDDDDDDDSSFFWQLVMMCGEDVYDCLRKIGRDRLLFK